MKNTNKTDKMLNIQVPATLLARIKNYCRDRGLKIKYWVAKALEEKINGEEK